MVSLNNGMYLTAAAGYWNQPLILPRSQERSSMKYKVLIADDRLPSRKGLRALMLTQPDIKVIGEANNGKEAVNFIEKDHPDVVIMDLRMPDMSGLEATKIIKEKWDNIRVIILTLYEEFREEAIDVGADAYLIKGCSPDDLISEIKGERRTNR
jgi:YesN/AraC family two-component response regulator